MKILKSKVLLVSTLLLIFSAGAFPQSKRVIGLIPYDNNGGSGHSWVARGIEDILTEKLSSLNSVSLYEKETLSRVANGLGVNSSKVVDAKKAFSVGKQTGVEVLFLGSYSVQGDQLNGKFRVVSTYTGSPIMDEMFNGPLDQISNIFEEKIRKAIATMQLPISSSEDALFAADMTSSIKAFESYCKAYVEIDKESPMEVVAGYFQRALQSDPQFWQARYNLGVIYYNSRFYDKALGRIQYSY